MTVDPAATVAPSDATLVPDIHVTRDPGGEVRATFFELFFDLVYVFAVTQLSHHLLAHLTWEGAAETTFLLLAVYWAWNYTTWMTNWFDPEVVSVRLLLVFVMLASLLMAVSIPTAFEDHGLLLAASYCALQVVRNAFVVAATPRGVFHRNFVQILAWSLVSVPLWVGGALVDGNGRWALWIPALAIDLAAPLARFWLPGMGHTPMTEWAIDPGHFAERFQLFIIIVLGESIVLTGGTAVDAGLDGPVITALLFAFASTVALWWLYFGRTATATAREEAMHDAPGQTARDAYTYLHLPIVAGVLLAAVSDELIIAHPSDDLGTAGALVTMAGPAIYLLGLAAFGRRVGRHAPLTGPIVALALLALVPVAAQLDGLVVAGAVTAVLVVLAATDGGLGRRRRAVTQTTSTG